MEATWPAGMESKCRSLLTASSGGAPPRRLDLRQSDLESLDQPQRPFRLELKLPPLWRGAESVGNRAPRREGKPKASFHHYEGVLGSLSQFGFE